MGIGDVAPSQQDGHRLRNSGEDGKDSTAADDTPRVVISGAFGCGKKPSDPTHAPATTRWLCPEAAGAAGLISPSMPEALQQIVSPLKQST